MPAAARVEYVRADYRRIVRKVDAAHPKWDKDERKRVIAVIDALPDIPYSTLDDLSHGWRETMLEMVQRAGGRLIGG